MVIASANEINAKVSAIGKAETHCEELTLCTKKAGSPLGISPTREAMFICPAKKKIPTMDSTTTIIAAGNFLCNRLKRRIRIIASIPIPKSQKLVCPIFCVTSIRVSKVPSAFMSSPSIFLS